MRYQLEKHHPDGIVTRERYESPHEFAPGDALSTDGYRWQVERVSGGLLVVAPARSGEVTVEHGRQRP